MLDIQDTLLSYAEVSVALAGFAAIVTVLSGRSEGWKKQDADRFHGMIIHSIFAVVFCMLPMILNVVVQDVVTTLHIACALLGVQVVVQSGFVAFFVENEWWVKLTMLFGVLVGLLQFSVFTDWAVHREFEVYQFGLIWHILQAGMLFVFLIWIKRSQIHSND